MPTISLLQPDDAIPQCWRDKTNFPPLLDPLTHQPRNRVVLWYQIAGRGLEYINQLFREISALPPDHTGQRRIILVTPQDPPRLRTLGPITRTTLMQLAGVLPKR